MIGSIIWYITTFGCAVLFFFIGVYARKREKPMWFWSGQKFDASRLTNVKAYNMENARMWEWYSVWYLAAGFAWMWSHIAALIILILSCTIGIGLLIFQYSRIEKKYIRQ